MSLPQDLVRPRVSSSLRPWPRVLVALLDCFELRCDGGTIFVPLPVQRLIALLALRDRARLRDQIAGELWPDSTQARAAASLRSAVWRLRRLPLPVVDVSATHVGLRANVKVDVHEFVQLASSVMRGSFDLEADEVDWIVRAGDLLPGWDEEWLAGERERVHQLRLHALEALATHLASRGRLAEAVDAGLAAVRGEPLRESAHRRLIEAYLAEGNAGEAVRHFTTYTELMRRELDIGPSPQMQALIDGVVTSGTRSTGKPKDAWERPHAPRRAAPD